MFSVKIHFNDGTETIVENAVSVAQYSGGQLETISICKGKPLPLPSSGPYAVIGESNSVSTHGSLILFVEIAEA
ncbi:hypothetical protein TAMA11512_08880 [Selenomonas sp. TAMA-11512]|uniref:hypothetical protein n=1 Tax=Selenomonas sp. TAMA-11512 TaxID=3095337 RepID=UPI00308FD10E|nr:hypothetical protein TAMA11512_08880 [Selenomonas sp. TAMA-11512]